MIKRVDLSDYSVATRPEMDMDDPSRRESLERLVALTAPLVDPAALGASPGFPQRKVFGSCRLCGTDTELTFEHVPPRAADNSDRRRGFTAQSLLVAGTVTDLPSNGWAQAQRGTGGYVLCRSCNNWCGSHLVRAYAEAAHGLLEALHDAFKGQAQDGVVALPGTIDLSTEGWRVGAVARQALVSLLAVSGGAAFSRRWPELQQVVRGSSATGLPSDLGLGLTIVVGSRSRITGLMGAVGPAGDASLSLEVAHMPFGWTLNVGLPTIQVVGTDVSDWLKYSIDETPALTVPLRVGSVTTPFGGDFREERRVRAEAGHQHDPEAPTG